jgi:hypothetical protein
MLGQCLTAQMTINGTAFNGIISLEYAYFHNNGVTIDPQVLNIASFPNFTTLIFTGPSISISSRLPPGDYFFDTADASHLI